MKSKTLISALTAFGLLAFAGSGNAQIVQTLTINLNVTHPDSYTNNGTTTIATSKTQAYHTADLLKILAEDEYNAGNLASSNLPAGAKLVVSNQFFLILNSTNGLVADVSSILSFDQPTGNEVDAGKITDSTGLASPSTTALFVGTFIFDDTALTTNGQNLQFYLQGLVKSVTTDAVNTKAGTYTETRTGQLSNGVGDGTSGGGAFITTGTLTASGKATLQIPLVTHLPK